MKLVYHKPPLSFQDQVKLLKSRNLIIKDEKRAISNLQEISYYRLSAHFIPYQSQKDIFDKGTTFEQIIKTYSFDRELRLLVFECIERIEVAIRTQIIYQMAIYYNDSHWQDNKAHFLSPFHNKIGKLVNPYNDFQNIIKKVFNAHNSENFINHYKKKYLKPTNPPSWMCFELLTIGELSNLYRGLKGKHDKKRIADFFDLHPTVFSSWLHSITYIRNICAHHSRLWNRDLAIEPEKLLKPKGAWLEKSYENNKRVFYFLCALRYILLRVSPNDDLPLKLNKLFCKYENVPVQYIGIPSDGKGKLLEWQNEPIWK